jgi:Transglutaminase-like superfamily/TgpA N-terminal domain/Domain of unknown function (DUF4129)
MKASSISTVGCVLVLAAVPITGYASLFGSGSYRTTLAGGWLVGIAAAAAAVGVHRRRPDPSAPHRRGRVTASRRVGSAAAVVLVVVLGSLLTRTGAGGPPLLGLPAAAARSAQLLVRLNQPVDVSADVLVVPFLLTSLSTALGLVALSVRTPLLPVLPPAVALFGQLLLCAGIGGRSAVGAAVLFCVTTALLLVLRRGGPSRTDRPRPARAVPRAFAVAVTLGAVGVLAFVAAAAGVAGVPGHRERFDPRERWQPTEVEERVTPLALLRAEMDEPTDEPRFTVRPLGATVVRRVAVAHLDTFDGAAWGGRARFRTAGTVLRPGPGRVSDTQAEVEFQVRSLPGRFLPTVGDPVRMRLRDAETDTRPVAFDPETGTLVATVDPAGWTYVESAARRAPSADPAPGTSRCRPHTGDPEFTARRREWLPDAFPSRGVLTKLENRMRTTLPYSPDAPPGSSLAAILRVLADDGPRSGGYSEQHAAAFSLLACAAGRPARVVVGYRQPDAGPDRVVRVGAHDAYAWSEVWLGPADGWVSFDPTDPAKAITPYVPAENGVVRPRPTGPRPDATPSGPPVAGPSPGPSPGGGSDVGAVRRNLLLLLLIGVVMIVAGSALTVGRSVLKARRGRRRRADERAALERLRHDKDSRRRLLAAWRLLLITVHQRGPAIPVSAPPEEVAARIDSTRGPGSGVRAADLAELVNAGTYGPGPATAEEARRAWELLDALTPGTRS